MKPKSSSTSSGQVKSRSSRLGAGAAGAGTGTLLASLAQNLPEHHPWKPWLILVAPSVSVAISVIYSWIRGAIENFLNNRELHNAVNQAKATLTEALQNPTTSEEHRKQLQVELQELELLLVRSKVDKIRTLTRSNS